MNTKIEFYKCKIEFHKCKIEFHKCKIEFLNCRIQFHKCTIEVHVSGRNVEFYWFIGIPKLSNKLEWPNPGPESSYLTHYKWLILGRQGKVMFPKHFIILSYFGSFQEKLSIYQILALKFVDKEDISISAILNFVYKTDI